jgi:hypothetical protein
MDSLVAEYDEKSPDYLDFNSLWPLVDSLRKKGFIPIKEFLDGIESYLYAGLPSLYKRVDYGSTPSIYDVAKDYNNLLTKILDSDKFPYEIKSLKRLNWYDIQLRLKWKGYTIFVTEDDCNMARCHAFDRSIKYLGSQLHYIPASAFVPFQKRSYVFRSSALYVVNAGEVPQELLDHKVKDLF